MPEKIILCATSYALTAGIWRGARLHSYQVYPNDERGQEDFTQFLQENPAKRVYLLADAVEEDYRVESLPHTTGKARQELLSRKLNQLYRGISYKAAHFIDRALDKRKDDRYLFASLSNADFMRGWMDCLQAEQSPLVGVFLLPMMSEKLVHRLKLAMPQLLLSERLNSGLRQTYLHNGSLRISRLAPIPADMQDRLESFYLAETEKTQLYMVSQRFITRENQLSMMILALNQPHRAICRSIEQEQGMTCESTDLRDIAQRFNLDAQQLAANPELLHMHLLATGSVPANLAPDSFLRLYQLFSLRRAISLATALIMLTAVAIAGFDVKQHIDYTAAQQQAILDTYLQEQHYKEVAKDFPSSPIPSNDLQAAAELYQTIKSYQKPPTRMMLAISRALDAAPDIQVNRLFWTQTNTTTLADEEKASAALPIAGSKSVAFVPTDAGVLYEVAYLNGEIKGFNGDYRNALNTVNRLAEQLNLDPAIAHVEVLEAPVNVSSYSNLQGSTTDEKAALQSAALFKLKLVLKREGGSP